MNIEPSGTRPPAAEARNSELSTLVHDLRNLVAPIRNATHILKLRNAGDSTLQSLAEMIDRQIVAICNLLDAVGHSPHGAVVPSFTGEAKEQSQQPTEPNPAPGKRALIADDNRALRVSLGALLREMGFEVRDAATGLEALTIAGEWLPSVVFLDVNMPNMNGFEVATALRSRFAATSMKLLMMSGESLNETVIKKAALAGFDHCLDKVSDLGSLQRFLENC